MNYTPVASGHIEALAWDADTMYVRFKDGKEYRFDGVGFSEYERILEAPSIGAEILKHRSRGVRV